MVISPPYFSDNPDVDAIKNHVALLESFGAQLPGVIWQCVGDQKGGFVYTYVSSGIKALCGLLPEHLLKNPALAWNCMDPDHKQRFYDMLVKAIDETGELEIEFPIIDPAGRERWLKTVAQPFVNEQGRTVLNGVSLDITQQKAAEKTLQQSLDYLEISMEKRTEALRQEKTSRRVAEGQAQEFESRFKELIEFSADAILHATLDGNFVAVNRKAVELLGYSREEFLAMHMENIHHESERAKAVAEFREAVKAGEKDTQEYRVVRKDGAVIPVEIKSRVINLKGQSLIQGIFRDISERKEREAREKHHHDIVNLLNSIASLANEATSAMDAMQQTVNRICANNHWPIGHVYVLDRNDPEKLVPSEIWHLDDVERFKDWDRLTRETVFRLGFGLPGKVARERRSIWTPDVGEEDWFLRGERARELGIKTGFALPILIGNEVPAVLEFFSTERIELDETLRLALSNVGVQIGRVFERERAAKNIDEARILAEAANQAKSDFIAGMSHELRTPLNAIIGFSDMIQQGTFGTLLNSRYIEYIQYINASAHHLLNLINDLLDLSAIEARMFDLHIEPVDVREVVEAATHLVSPQARKKNLRLALHADERLPRVLSDHRRLKQVMLNLLNNAVKYTPENGSIDVTIGAVGGKAIEIVVADTGVGMSPEDLQNAFLEFTKIKNILTRKEEGVGLGLPLTRGLVDMLGGTIDMSSALGVGTTATITLPTDP